MNKTNKATPEEIEAFKQSEYKKGVVGIVLFAVIGIILAVLMMFTAHGVTFKNSVSTFASVLLFTSIIKYSYSYYVKGDHTLTIDHMLIRFAASFISSLLMVRNGNTVLFLSYTMILFLVPYIAGSSAETRKGFCISIIVFILTVLIGITQVILLIKHNEISKNWYYYFFPFIPLIQWSCLCAIYHMRIREKLFNQTDK